MMAVQIRDMDNVGKAREGSLPRDPKFYDTDSDSDERDDLGMLFHNVTSSDESHVSCSMGCLGHTRYHGLDACEVIVPKSWKTENERHRELTLKLAQIQYEEDEGIDYKREYARIINHFDPDYMLNREQNMAYCKIRPERRCYPVFGVIECAVLHMEAPCIPFLAMDAHDDYELHYERIVQRFPSINRRNFMAYVNKCHRVFSDIIANGYFELGTAKYERAIKRCLLAVRTTGMVPPASVMLGDHYPAWIVKHHLGKGDKTGDFIWNYLLHFSLMYHPVVKKHKKFKLLVSFLVQDRVNCANGHMFDGFLDSAINGIKDSTYANVASKLFTAVGDQLKGAFGIPDRFVEIAGTLVKLVGGLLSTSVVLFAIRHILGETHTFVCFLKNLIFPHITRKQWVMSAPEDTDKNAEGHMLENIKPLVIRFGIMLVQAVANKPTNAREVSDCLRTVMYGSTLLETLMTNTEPLFRMLAFKITGDKMWINAEMDDDIKDHLEEIEDLRSVQNIHMRVSNDLQLNHRVRDRYRWQQENCASLRSAGIRDKSLGAQLGRAERDLNKWYEYVVAAGGMSASRKFVPISVMIQGPVNHGKTAMVAAIVKVIHQFFKGRGMFTNDVQTCYQKARDTVYWDGYNHHITYVVDEFLASSQAVVRDEQLMEMIGCVNGGNYPLNYADCKSKGTDNFDSPLIVYTTNFDKWKTIQVTDPQAIFKRIHYPLELKRGKTVTCGADIPDAWLLTCTQHAFENKQLYAGTSEEFWKATIVDGARQWITFAQMMRLILADFTRRLDAKPLSDNMGDVKDFCEEYFPAFFKEGEMVETVEEFVGYERLEESDEDFEDSEISELVELTPEEVLNPEFDQTELLAPYVDTSVSADGQMFNWWHSYDPGVVPLDYLAELASRVDLSDAQFDTFEKVLLHVCEIVREVKLESHFPEIVTGVEDLLVMKDAHGSTVCPVGLIPAFRLQLITHRVFYEIVKTVALLQPDTWYKTYVHPMLTSVVRSCDGTILPALFPEAFEVFVLRSYRKFLAHDHGVLMSCAETAYLAKRAHHMSKYCDMDELLWNNFGVYNGERRYGRDDMCATLGKSHVCSLYYTNDGFTQPVVRKVNDVLHMIGVIAKHVWTSVSLFSSQVFNDVRAGAIAVYQWMRGIAPFLMVQLAGAVIGAGVGLAVGGTIKLINHLIHKNSDGHSETHKNPMFMRKGRDMDAQTKYSAKGHSHLNATDLKLSAITSRNLITRHFVIMFEDKQEVRGKCICLGKYVFFHSHILWAFPSIHTIVFCNDPNVQEGGSYMLAAKDFILRDYMDDAENARDMVRLTMKSNNQLGKNPAHYLIPRDKWKKRLCSQPLVRVLGSGVNRKVSITHVVPEVFAIGRSYGTRIEVDGEVIIREHEAGYMAYRTPSLPGDCSDPYMSGTKLLGLHVAFAGCDSVFMPIYAEDCEDDIGTGCMEYMSGTIVANDLNMVSGVNPIGMLSNDWTGRARCAYTSTIYGPRGEEGVGGFRPSCFPLNRVPSPLLGLDGTSPWTKQNLNYTRTFSPSVPVPYDLATKINPTAYLDDFFGVPRDVRSRRLTDDEVDNGIPGYLVSMDMSTSPGMIGKVHNCTKLDLYVQREDGGYDPGPHLIAAALDIQKMICNNTVPMVVCCENLKTETLPPGKYPRCFTGVSLEHVRWTKAVTGDALAYMKKHIVGSSCAVGINPHSLQWSHLYTEFVDAFGDKGAVIGGDLSNCDLSCHPVFATAMAAFLNKFYRYDLDSLLYRELLFCCLSIVNQQRVRGKRFFELYRGHPSGHYLTTLFNCIVVYSIHRYAYDQLVDTRMYPWCDNVRLKVYGDDSLGCVNEPVQKVYNMRSIQPFFTLFGMIYTDPAKSENVPEFLPRAQAAFLGRGFRPTETTFCAPLNHDAIYGMIHWVRTESMSVDEALDVNIRCALMEMYHHGREEFNKFKFELFKHGNERGYVSSSLIGPLNYDFFYSWHTRIYAGCDDTVAALTAEYYTDLFFC